MMIPWQTIQQWLNTVSYRTNVSLLPCEYAKEVAAQIEKLNVQWLPTKVVWDEPGDIGQSNQHRELTIAEAVEQQKVAARQHNNHVYRSNHEALMDFLTIHWASLE